jgi:hypothetical protein
VPTATTQVAGPYESDVAILVGVSRNVSLRAARRLLAAEGGRGEVHISIHTTACHPPTDHTHASLVVVATASSAPSLP